jgi:hypothetical protein
MKAHEKARLLCVLQSTTCWVSQTQSTLENDLKLHQKTTKIADNLTLQHLWFMLQKEDMLRCFALVALIIRDWMCINYIMIKAAILIDRIKIRSQHSQNDVIIIVWLSSRHTKGYEELNCCNASSSFDDRSCIFSAKCKCSCFETEMLSF